MTAPPLLRTLVPALRGLDRELAQWLDAPNKRFTLPTLVQAQLQGLREDVRRRADDLDLEQPLLIVMLMGGTGVGKSTLLNALAGGPIAQASFTRPTTRDPTVYHHNSVKPARLDAALQKCRLVAHDREELREKVLVDTPDLDSNEEANRERLKDVLPVADVVLYVGSQEKYHDRLGWDLFREQRQRRAFAFVLNKWDRCVAPTAGGMRPDQDWLNDLRSEGFTEPLLFRTSAQHWIDKPNDATPPEGDQFRELERWLEEGLSRLEIEAIKARGIEQLLDQLASTLEAARPPDLAAAVDAATPTWQKLLDDESEQMSAALVHALEPYQRDIEFHFRLTGQQRFQRLMAGYLGLINRLQSAGNRLRNPAGAMVPSSIGERSWDVVGLTRQCLNVATQRGLDQRVRALGDRLLVAADAAGFPTELIAPRLRDLSKLDWKGQFGEAVSDALGTVERDWAKPSGSRKLIRGTVIFLANIVPELTFVGSVLLLIWNVTMREHPLSLASVFVPFVLTLAVLMVFHVITHLILPLRWPAIRGDFRNHLEHAVREKLSAAYEPLPAAVASDVMSERQRLDRIADLVREIAALLDARRQAARIDSLYGASR